MRMRGAGKRCWVFSLVGVLSYLSPGPPSGTRRWSSSLMVADMIADTTDTSATSRKAKRKRDAKQTNRPPQKYSVSA